MIPLGTLWIALALAVAAPAIGQEQTERPRLAVVLVVDQMSGELLDRFAPLFGPDGFRRLIERGAEFSHCRHEHVPTFTAPGHAALLSGAHPRRSGVVGNRWYSRAEGRTVGAVEDRRYPLVPAEATGGGSRRGVAPSRLRGGTVGDVLRLATSFRAKVVAASLKDRSAVLLGGKRPNGAFWFDERACRFVTSTYYAARLPEWVERFNGASPCADFVGRDWSKLRADVDYGAFADADDVPYERNVFGLGRVFPHPLDEFEPRATGSFTESGDRYSAVAVSPFGNDLVLNLARAAVWGEGLGQDEIPDLLALGLSSNDAVGHIFGPNSQEVLDTTLRTDRQVAEFMRFLDQNVGAGRWLLVLTSDHGVAPIPEYLERVGLLPDRPDDYRFDTSAARARVERRLAQRFFPEAGAPPAFGGFFESWNGRTMPWVYLRRQVAGELPGAVSFAEVVDAAVAEIRSLDGVERVYRAQEPPRCVGEDPFAQRVAHGWNRREAGDLLVQLRPYWLEVSPHYATTHGSPYSYDTNVPMLLYGRGIRSGRYARPVASVDLASTLADLLGVAPPPLDEGQPLFEALE